MPVSLTASELQTARDALGLSQAALARLLGVHIMTVSMWERGRANAPAWLALALAAIARVQTKGE